MITLVIKLVMGIILSSVDYLADINMCVVWCTSDDNPWYCGLTATFTVAGGLICNLMAGVYLSNSWLFERWRFWLMIPLFPVWFLIWLGYLLVETLQGAEMANSDMERLKFLRFGEILVETVGQICLQTYIVLKANYLVLANETTSEPGVSGWAYVSIAAGLLLMSNVLAGILAQKRGKGTKYYICYLGLFTFGIGSRTFCAGLSAAVIHPTMYLVPTIPTVTITALYMKYGEGEQLFESLTYGIIEASGNFVTRRGLPSSCVIFTLASVLLGLYTNNPIVIANFVICALCLCINILGASFKWDFMDFKKEETSSSSGNESQNNN